MIKKSNIDKREIIKAMFVAVYDGDIERLNMCISLNVDIYALNNEKKTAMHVAVILGHLEIIRIFLMNGFPINRRAHYECGGYTLLHIAILNKKYELIHNLILWGADLYKECRAQCWSPLEYILHFRQCANNLKYKESDEICIRMESCHLRISRTELQYIGNATTQGRYPKDIYNIIINIFKYIQGYSFDIALRCFEKIHATEHKHKKSLWFKWKGGR